MGGGNFADAPPPPDSRGGGGWGGRGGPKDPLWKGQAAGGQGPEFLIPTPEAFGSRDCGDPSSGGGIHPLQVRTCLGRRPEFHDSRFLLCGLATAIATDIRMLPGWTTSR